MAPSSVIHMANIHVARSARCFVQASRARDVVEAHYPAFQLNRVPVREVSEAAGEAYLAVLAEDVGELAGRIKGGFA